MHTTATADLIAPIPVRLPPRSVWSDLRAIKIVWHREMLRFLNDKVRIPAPYKVARCSRHDRVAIAATSSALQSDTPPKTPRTSALNPLPHPTSQSLRCT